MALRKIGSVDIDSYVFDPSFELTSDNSQLFRTYSITGSLEWDPADQLSELVANRALLETIGGESGVPAYLWADDELLSTYNGWYLLQSFRLTGEQESSLGGPTGPRSGLVGFALGAVNLGDYVPS